MDFLLKKDRIFCLSVGREVIEKLFSEMKVIKVQVVILPIEKFLYRKI